MNMFLHDVNYDKFNIKLGDTLLKPQLGDEKPFDAIVSNPPYSTKWIGSDDPTLINDDRFAPTSVLAPKSKADFAFVLHALSYLSAKGRAAIVCFRGIFYRGGAEQKIRKYLADNNFVETVIALAPNLFFGTSIAVNILVLSKSKTENKTQFIDASSEDFFKKKSDFTESGIGCIHYGQIHTYYGTFTDKTISYVSEEFAKKARKAKTGDLVIATTSKDDKDVCKAVAWLGKDEVAVSSDACFLRHSLSPKYVAYFFQTHEFQKQKQRFITGAKVRRVNADNLAKIKILIPPLSEQERIVNILDKFDTLVNSISEGLPREIELRQKQYEYYRDQLLNFS